jgi:hypothetical protein
MFQLVGFFSNRRDRPLPARCVNNVFLSLVVWRSIGSIKLHLRLALEIYVKLFLFRNGSVKVG